MTAAMADDDMEAVSAPTPGALHVDLLEPSMGLPDPMPSASGPADMSLLRAHICPHRSRAFDYTDRRWPCSPALV